MTEPRVAPRSFWSDFWDRFDRGLWEPQTLRKLCALTEGDLFVDIGAWIGPTALTAAVNGARVLAFEPDPVARQELEDNVKANPGVNVTVYPIALSDREGVFRLTAHDWLGDSMSSLARRRTASALSSLWCEPGQAPLALWERGRG